jgi:hypothetical protein
MTPAFAAHRVKLSGYFARRLKPSSVQAVYAAMLRRFFHVHYREIACDRQGTELVD